MCGNGCDVGSDPVTDHVNFFTDDSIITQHLDEFADGSSDFLVQLDELLVLYSGEVRVVDGDHAMFREGGK